MNDGLMAYFADKVGYSEAEAEQFLEGGHRPRLIRALAKAKSEYVIRAAVVEARHCNSGHIEGQAITLDIVGNVLADQSPPAMCVYLLSQLAVPVALIGERLSEGLDPRDFTFMRYTRCPDAGVDCYGYGQVLLKVDVVPVPSQPA